MADVQPLRALHYDPAVAGPLKDVVAPPYDVIDASQRAELIARSPYNVVGVDLPQGEPDAYAAARELFESWQLQGALVRDAEPALWAHTQDYCGPDGERRSRRGLFCRVLIEGYGPGRVRPHERTHPGPKEDRLRLTRATRANISPIFSLFSDPANAAWAALEPFTAQAPWGEVTDADDTVHRLWRVADPQAIAAVQAATRDAELLIADGHHRYETMQAYADEVGGDGEHRYILMCLVALEDPGLTVFPTHRLVNRLDDARRAALTQALERDFEIREVPDRAGRSAAGRRAAAAGLRQRAGRARVSPDAEGPGDRRRGAERALRGLPTSRHGRVGDVAAEGRARALRRRHLALQRHCSTRATQPRRSPRCAQASTTRRS